MQKLRITSMGASEIEDLLKSKEDYKIAVRLVSLLPIAKGESSRKTEELLLSHNQICIWAKRFNESGLQGLQDPSKTGRKPKISEEQSHWLKHIVLEVSTTVYGYNTETTPLLVELLKKECNPVYSDDMVYIVLKKS